MSASTCIKRYETSIDDYSKNKEHHSDANPAYGQNAMTQCSKIEHVASIEFNGGCITGMENHKTCHSHVHSS